MVKMAAAGVGIVIVGIFVAGFVIYIPVTTAKAVPYLLVNTQTITYTTSSTTTVPVSQEHTQTSTVWTIPQSTLGCNQYVYSSSFLTTGWDVQISWSASDTVDVYVFDSAQYSAYTSSGTTSQNILAMGSAPASGTTGFHVSLSDTYYFVLHNPHNGLACFGSQNLGIFSGSGTATYQVSSTVYVSQVVTYTTSSVTLQTQTLTSTSTASCSYQFWSWAAGSRSCS